jgi:hypothetical protein
MRSMLAPLTGMALGVALGLSLQPRGLAQEPPAGSNGGFSDLQAGADVPQLREEFFALSLPVPATPLAPDATGAREHALAAPPAPPVGVVCLRKSAVPSGEQLEWEFTFPDEQLRVLHVERLTKSGPKLVWRELRPGAGRTLLSEWNAQGRELDVVEWGRPQIARHRLDASEGALFPLFLLELARKGGALQGRHQLFDPTSLSLESIEMETRYFGEPVGAAHAAAGDSDEPTPIGPQAFELRREVRLSRDDGTCAGSYVFQGTELLSFQWQSGGLEARRISAEDYERERIRTPVSALPAAASSSAPPAASPLVRIQ